MTDTIRITTLVENTAVGRKTLAEHGLSFWIQAGDQRILFDTGQTPDVLFHNAARFKIDLTTINAIVLSHGHYDHTGGLLHVLKHANHPNLFLHPAALVKRYSRHAGGVMVDAGMVDPMTGDELAEYAQVIWTQAPTQVVGSIWATGQVPRITDFEDTGGDFYLDEDADKVDPIDFDQSIYFDTPQGLVVLLGCAHAGVINILHHIRKQTSHRPIYALIGGMHLLHASEDRMSQTIESIRGLDIQLLAPTHCTGPFAAAKLWSEFPDRWQPCRVGAQFTFEMSSGI